jgi:very-short-patch-repair endonuclease
MIRTLGKTYEEICGVEKAKQLKELRRIRMLGNTYCRGKILPINKSCICKFCGDEFLSSVKTTTHCIKCNSFVTLKCICGCNSTSRRKIYQVNDNLPILSKGHNLRTGKTFIEIHGKNADEVKRKISEGLKKAPRKKYKRKKKRTFICKYCFNPFLAADVKACICKECSSLEDILCSCGCKEIVKRQKWQIAQNNSIFKIGHNLKGRTYEEIHGTSTPNCGFKRGELNIVHDPEVKQKIANFHATKTIQSGLEKKLIPYLSEWKPQYLIGWYCVDFALLIEKKVLEVNGCYWHCCTKCNYQPKTKDQFTALVKDKRMKTYLQNRGWSLEVLWEHDVEEWIKKQKGMICLPSLEDIVSVQDIV